MRESHIRRRSLLKYSSAAALGLSTAGCSGETEQAAQTPSDGGNASTGTDSPSTTTAGEGSIPRGGTLRVGLQEGPSTMNPYTGVSVNDDLIQAMVYTGGTVLDPVTSKVRPWAYSDWTVENAESGQPDVYFSVRDGLTWTDGEELQLDDVLFTYDYLLEQEPGFYAGQLDPIETVEEASNDYDVHLQLNERVGAYTTEQLSFPLVRRDVYEGENLQQYQPGADAVGLGYGRVTTYDPDTAIEIELRDPESFPLSDLEWLHRTDQYTPGGPYLDRVRFLIYGSTSAVEQALLNGEIDTIKNTIRASNLEQVEESERLGTEDGIDSGWRHVLFNLRNKPLGDITFRQALGFLWDDQYYRERLFRGLLVEGDFPIPPGHTLVRPESSVEGAEIATHPASNAFTFRGENGSPDVEGVRSFLTNGEVITGEGGTYVGQEYPGSLTGVTASVTEAANDYTFGPVESENLTSASVDVERELRVDGDTIPEILGGPLTYLLAPPKSRPRDHKMGARFMRAMRRLGIPVVAKPMSFNTLNPREFRDEDFDLVQTGWAGISPLGAPSLNALFHSSAADDHSEVEEGTDEENSSQYFANAAGYGLFDAGADDLLESAATAMDIEEMRAYSRQAAERIYLDFPIMVAGYQQQKWPVNTADFGGYIGDVTSPGQSYMWLQWLNVHQT